MCNNDDKCETIVKKSYMDSGLVFYFCQWKEAPVTEDAIHWDGFHAIHDIHVC